MLIRVCLVSLIFSFFSTNLSLFADITEKNSGKDKTVLILLQSADRKAFCKISMNIPAGWTCTQDEECNNILLLEKNDISVLGGIKIIPEASLSDKFIKQIIESEFKKINQPYSKGSVIEINRGKMHGYYAPFTIRFKDYVKGKVNEKYLKDMPDSEILKAFIVVRNGCCLVNFLIRFENEKEDIRIVEPVLNMLENLSFSDGKDKTTDADADAINASASAASINKSNADSSDLAVQANIIQKCSRGIESNPNDAIAYFNRANAYLRTKQFDKAIQDMTTLIELKPKEPGNYIPPDLYSSAYLLRGIIYATMQQHDKAIQDYSKSIESLPGIVAFTGYWYRGNSYSAMRKYNKAIQDYSKTIELKPDYAEAYFGRANAYVRLKQYNNAIQDFSEAINLKPDYWDAYNCRGWVYHAIKQYDKAIQDYLKVIELKPGHPVVYLNLGSTYCRIKQYDKAIQIYSKCVELKPDCVEAYNFLGWLYNKTKQYDKSIQNYSKAIELNQNPITYLNIMETCIIAVKSEQFKQQLKQFETAIPEDKLSKENLVIKLYLTCIEKCALNEPMTDVELRLDALLKGNVKLSWSFDLIDEWLDNQQNGLNPEQVKYIRGLTDKIKASQKN